MNGRKLLINIWIDIGIKSYMKRLVIIQISIVLLSVILIVIGTYLGNVSMVLNKAIRICLECIGIG